MMHFLPMDPNEEPDTCVRTCEICDGYGELFYDGNGKRIYNKDAWEALDDPDKFSEVCDECDGKGEVEYEHEEEFDEDAFMESRR